MSGKDFMCRPAVPVIISSFLFLLYTRTLYPTVAGGDSGELITAAFFLGVPHPPGYPLYTLAAAAAIRLLEPTGWEVAYRANLLSASLGSLTGVMLYLSLLRWLKMVYFHELSDSTPTKTLGPFEFCVVVPALWGALSFSANVHVWNAFTQAEVQPSLMQQRPCLRMAQVFSLNNFICASILFWNEGWKSRLLLSCSAFITGLLPYLYLPWASANSPDSSWGGEEVSTIEGFQRHLLRREYGTFKLVPNVTILMVRALN
eukprot:749242-Hanusia_phi.AAC.7